MITAKRPKERCAHRADILPDRRQFRPARQGAGGMNSLGDLIDVRANLAELPEEPHKLRPLDRGPADGTRSWIAKGHGPQKGADAKAGLCGPCLNSQPFVLGAAQVDKPLSRVLHAHAPPPRRGFSVRTCNRPFTHSRAPP